MNNEDKIEKLEAGLKKLEQFVTGQLVEEIAQFRDDRKIQKQALKTLEKFVIGELAEEITEFHLDKEELHALKAKLKKQIAQPKAEREKEKNKDD